MQNIQTCTVPSDLLRVSSIAETVHLNEQLTMVGQRLSHIYQHRSLRRSNLIFIEMKNPPGEFLIGPGGILDLHNLQLNMQRPRPPRPYLNFLGSSKSEFVLHVLGRRNALWVISQDGCS